MKKILAGIICGLTISLAAHSYPINQAIKVPSTTTKPLLDGQCDDREWQPAHKLQLPAKVSILLMNDSESFYICMKGKKNDYTTADIYIEHPESKSLWNLHASAQIGEREFDGKQWPDFDWWNHQQWSAFWVPFSGSKETDKGTQIEFLKGTHREFQILRSKFSGNTWRVMLRVGGINHQNSGRANLFYPQEAKDTSSENWMTIQLTSR
ncbi:hypothetical protein [Aliikangiella sp. G2MR2-5]|uniref:hypothetical protein n=1 Tax=Aliikangiella sp. G2MR2-5 TaxID=2788943 RepID=UPI0018AC4F63|nr:hypothetical protein [Aliikangiella sp. G2MR2-5]